MNFRLKMVLTLVFWGAFLAVSLAVTYFRLWYLAFPVNCGGIIATHSAAMRLWTGKWPDWPGVLRLMISGKEKHGKNPE